MRVVRVGSAAHHGESSIKFGRLDARWISDEGAILLGARHVRDFSTRAHHDYKILVTLEEMCQMLDVVAGEAASEAPDIVGAALAPSLRSLLRLAGLCIGPITVLSETSSRSGPVG
jgi:hypothetical protein